VDRRRTLLPRTTKGVLELRVTGVGSNATSRLLLPNMSLVAKKTPVPEKPWLQRVQVWALDMETNALLGDVEVSLVRKSGKTVARCTTGSGSGCVMATKRRRSGSGGAVRADRAQGRGPHVHPLQGSACRRRRVEHVGRALRRDDAVPRQRVLRSWRVSPRRYRAYHRDRARRERQGT
jgi:hypothetical protein